jgi:ABC-type bacteriocin/lantibiotic exporter with double-glycine peptidase domain
MIQESGADQGTSAMNENGGKMPNEDNNDNVQAFDLAIFRNIRFIFALHIRKEKKNLLIGSIFAIASSVSLVLCFFYIQYMLDYVIIGKKWHDFYYYVEIIMFWYFVNIGAGLFTKYYCTKASELIIRHLRADVVSDILKKPIIFFSDFEKGDIIARVSNDIDYLSTFFFDYVVTPISYMIELIIFLGVIFFWNWKLGIFVAAALSLNVIFFFIVQGPLEAIATKARQKFSLQNDVLMDVVAGYKDIRFFQQHVQAKTRYEQSLDRYTEDNIKSSTWSSWATLGYESIARFTSFVPYFFGGYMILQQSEHLTVGTLVTFAIYVDVILDILFYLMHGVTKLGMIGSVINRVREILEYPEEQETFITSLAQTPDNTEIVFKDITYGYMKDKPLLKNFNLTIAQGDKIAILGTSGSGKSTLLNLLIRQIKPDSGEVLFGGKPIQEYPLPFYYHYFAYVGQQPHIFKISLKDNIAFGWYHIPQDKIIEAAKKVRLDDIIEKLPNKYDTIYGEKGFYLSGGQTQRLFLGRAIVRDPEILLLDEFTSALDQDVQVEILDEIFRIFDKQTIICVTHSALVAERFRTIIRMEKY